MEKYNKDSRIDVVLVPITQKICLQNIQFFVGFMPKDRIEKFNRLQKKSDKINCLIGYFALFYSLKKFKKIQNPPKFIYDRNNKPKLIFPNIYFNITHTKNLVAVAISKNPVGIDAETIRKVNPKLIRKILCENEYLKFKKTSNKEKFIFKTWTKKEAYCKRKSISIFNNLLKIDSTTIKNTKTFFFNNSAISIASSKNFKYNISTLENLSLN